MNERVKHIRKKQQEGTRIKAFDDEESDLALSDDG